MTGLFRPLKRRTGVLVAAAGVAGCLGAVVSLLAGDTVLAVSAGVTAVGYSVAVLVGLFTARNPQSVAYLAVAAAGILVTLSALADARVTFAVAALLLVAAGGLLYRAGQLPTADETANETAGASEDGGGSGSGSEGENETDTESEPLA